MHPDLADEGHKVIAATATMPDGVQAYGGHRAGSRRPKGQDGAVKRNAIARHRFESWAALEAHLACWTREVADVRVHGTTGEAPIARFERDEAAALKPIAGRAPFRQLRELVRVVQSNACIELDTNRYSVRWRLIGATVTVLAGEDGIVVSHAGSEGARHEARRPRAGHPADSTAP